MIVARLFCGAFWLLLVRANDAEDPSLLVFDGKEARLGMFPSIGALELRSSTEVFQCGAVLIDSEWAVTAAHCFYDDTTHKVMKFLNKRIIFGDMQPYEAGMPTSRQESSFNFTIHKRYKSKRDTYDIALLHLEKPVTPTVNVAPITFSTSSHETETHRDCQVAGWGEKGPNIKSNKLLYADIEVGNGKACKKKYKSRFNRRIMLCAGSEKSDACPGDSGGPLYCINRKSGNRELVGIVSYGVSVCMPSSNGVYTRVSAFTKWINSRGEKYALPPWAWVLIALAVVIVFVITAVIVIVKVKD